MKKKLLILAIGALAIVNSSFAQPPTANPVYISIPGQNGPGPISPITGQGTFQVFATGTVNGAAVSNFAITAQDAVSMNTIFTVNGQMYGIVLSTNPAAFNPLQNGLYDYFVVVDLNGNGANNVNYGGLGGTLASNSPVYGGDQVFGTQNGNFTVIPVPFDFGISAVLGAGAIAAVKTARRRRKEQQATV
ncbi:MAG: hypothetical protein EOO01_03855 [Chitinophagaceae bacterium]|nr:MAG: hypothetical protein EOO01_03855 [Chitinophagaceae bacterium]